jgi:DnaJ-class molecular chaperone
MDIKICNSCDGKGDVKQYDNHNDYEIVICKKCYGTGRVLTRTYTYEVPFGTDINILYKLDSEIFGLIRKLESDKIK